MRSFLKDLKTTPEWHEKNRKIALQLESFLGPTFLSSNSNQIIIGAYAPFGPEASWTDFLQSESKRREQLKWAFPFLSEKEGEMEFALSRFSDLEIRKDFGVDIKVPKKDSIKVVPDLLLLPGLAFSKKGERLGKGKGFYDKFLDMFKGVTVGIGFEEQIVEDLPVEQHDKKVSYLVTDKNFYRCLKE